MPTFDTISALRAISVSELTAVANQLDSTGFITDEDDLAFGSDIIEHWKAQCDQILINAGYGGGKLASTGKYFPQCGSIYVLYDSARHTRDDAVHELERAASKHPLP